MSEMLAERPAAFAEPAKPVTGRWVGLFGLAWLGIWMAQLTPVQLLLPEQVEAQRPASDWVGSVMAFGVISGVAGLFALVAYPLTGALSDRTTSRFGRRRPWIAIGTLLFAVSLVVLGTQTGVVAVGIWWTLALIGFCVLTAALTATISDQVPVGQRGFVSGWISAPQAIGTILGLLLVTTIFTGRVRGYTTVAVLLVALVLPFLLGTPDAALRQSDKQRFSLRGLLAGFWVSPKQHPDFGWTLLSRILVNLGNAFGTTLLLYFLKYHVHAADPDGSLLLLSVIYMFFVIAASLYLGRLSDRLGRRKIFVITASASQALAAILLAVFPNLTVATVGAGLLGLGYGCFLSVDQALATQVLPDPATHGKDLGIMNIATTVPQAVAPLVGAAIVAYAGGFGVLYLIAGLTSLVGALCVAPVKGVK
ncbi:MAG: MFS transporter [Hamadaea sp.]|uniref:MFS transporter n=1 Tax=Hamadaea sp. TaxID=2024425 RepID=UPI00180CE545|nr:MFS transporter [Hamadaea sp.]NUR69847.1 MFS transporter [Hamadaea sp.]NUT19173.1 MFS transporter [Hamadaea sp.]